MEADQVDGMEAASGLQGGGLHAAEHPSVGNGSSTGDATDRERK
jgi:hypothetical protein